MKRTTLLSLCLAPVLACAQSAPPPLFTFAPGSRYDVLYAISLPSSGSHRFDSAIVAGTPFAEMSLGKNFFLESSALGGVSLNHQVLTGGYSIGARLDFSFRGSPVDGSLKFGFDQLYSQGTSAKIGIVAGFSVWFAPKAG